jgi:hypothetical protein
VAGARETLDPLNGDFLLRLVPHLDVAQLETLIRSANGQNPCVTQIDTALASFSKRPGAVDRLVEASVRAQDFKRASRVLAEGRFEAATPAARLAKILESYHRADISGAVESWVTLGGDKVARSVLLATGALIAPAALKEALAKTRSLEGAGDYWAEVIRTFVDSLPKTGRYGQAELLKALAREYAVAFQDVQFETYFWEKQAEETREKQVAEALWRIECLRQAARTAPEETRCLDLAGRFAAELVELHDPTQAREGVQELAPKIASAEGRTRMASLVEELQGKEAEEQRLLVKNRAEAECHRARGEVNSLKLQVTQFKGSNGAPEVIRGLEHRIEVLEKDLRDEQ